MKFAAFATTAIIVLVNVVAGADPMPAVLPPSKALEVAQSASAPPSKALEVAQSASAPEGVEFTGSVETIEQPAGAKETINALQTTHDGADGDKEQQFGWGAGYGAGYGWGLGGWGNWGGWGGFGPYRFGFQCGGVPGWAYPLSYWNLFGSGLYGGSCGLGMPFGGLYYC